MSLEYTKHMTEKDLHRHLPSVRDIRTLLLHFSSVTPNQQLKQSFQTFAALPVDETTQQTSQIQTAVQNESSVGSYRSVVIAKDFFKSLILSAVSLDDAVIDLWMQATRHGRVDFAEVCCTSDSLLSGAITSIGGRAVQYSHWHGFDLTTKGRTDTPDSVTIQEIFDECTAASNDLRRNRGFSPLLGKTQTDKSVCENHDLAQCSVEVADEAAKQRLRVKEESYKAYIEEELSLRKRRKVILHQARPWRHWAAGEWCWYGRSGKHKCSRMKGGVFLGLARVLLQERESTAEGVRMKGVVWITEGTSLFRCAVQHLRSLSESETRLCSIADTAAISFQDLVRRLPHSTFLDLTTQTDAPDDAWEEEITGWDPRSTRDPSSGSSFWPHQSDATSRLGPDLVPPSRPVRTDDAMSVQEHETTRNDTCSVHTSFGE